MKTQRLNRTKTMKDDKSCVAGQKGQGVEGQRKGYGGSAGNGTGASGADEGSEPEDFSSPSLPSRSHLERVLR
jgi:hypothetical protein